MISVSENKGIITIQLPESHLTDFGGIYEATMKSLGQTPDRVITQQLAAAYRPAVEFPQTMKGLNNEQAADTIKNYLVHKSERAFGKRNNAYLIQFYSALSAAAGANLHDAYVNKLKQSPAAKGHYPLRKIDAVVALLGAEYVYQFAKDYEFKVGKLGA